MRLTPRQRWVLQRVARAGGAWLGEDRRRGRLTGITPWSGNLARTLRSLERMGLVGAIACEQTPGLFLLMVTNAGLDEMEKHGQR